VIPRARTPEHRYALIAAMVTVGHKKLRSEENCRYVRELMRQREPQIAAAYDKAVRDA
jgi:hypothetical protein